MRSQIKIKPFVKIRAIRGRKVLADKKKSFSVQSPLIRGSFPINKRNSPHPDPTRLDLEEVA